ncbi:MAG: DNA/RNA helicase domain-containing protein [Nanoarchaeota archaeon]
MRLYENTIEQFKSDVIENKIAGILTKNFETSFGRRTSSSEIHSWSNSLNFVKNAFDYSDLKDDYVVVEYQIPYSSSRIDVLLFGKDISMKENVLVIELKQWSNENVTESKNEGNVIVNYGRNKIETEHPCLQVQGYHFWLNDFVSVFEEPQKIDLSSCVYCHNYSRNTNDILYSPRFKILIDKYPLFSKDDIKDLGQYLSKRLSQGDGLEVFNHFIKSPIKPSKKLLEHTKEMINKQQIFNLIDDQIPAYNAIMHKAMALSSSKKKSIIIVKGGPGTGKSVIALEVMAELMRKGKMVYHATGSSAFTNTLRNILGARLKSQFKFFNSFSQHKDNSVDVLICDEAHRIRKTSQSRYTPKSQISGLPQMDEIIKCAKLSIFFIDEMQIVRPTEIGSVSLIKESGKKFEVEDSEILEFELNTQFRCGGSNSFLVWVENVLQIGLDEPLYLDKQEKMEIKIVDSPNKLKKMIDDKNKEKKNSARIVAGFCWPWSQPKEDGTLVKDVKIGDFEMPWENKNDFWKWATDDSGMEQVGTVYTSQGFEFDYIGIIFGNDLIFDKKIDTWIAKPENSYDQMVKTNNTNFIEHLKNIYRVLLTRAHKGCYVYFMDKDTEEYFKSRIRRN